MKRYLDAHHMQPIFAKATGREIHEHLFVRESANGDKRFPVKRVLGSRDT
ncbi:hypothetical protein [Caballeronia sp. 15715]